MKLIAADLGGTRTPMVISWPRRIKPDKTPRPQFHHVNDVAPTLYEILGIRHPDIVDGHKQDPIDGTSFAYTFDSAAAPERKKTQYFEIMGSRGIYSEGWMASTFGPRRPWVAELSGLANWDPKQDRWELFDTRKDYSLAQDLAAGNPRKLEELKALFMKQAEENRVLPIGGGLYVPLNPQESKRSTNAEWTLFEGMTRIPESQAPNVRNGNGRAEIEAVGVAMLGVLATHALASSAPLFLRVQGAAGPLAWALPFVLVAGHADGRHAAGGCTWTRARRFLGRTSHRPALRCQHHRRDRRRLVGAVRPRTGLWRARHRSFRRPRLPRGGCRSHGPRPASRGAGSTEDGAPRPAATRGASGPRALRRCRWCGARLRGRVVAAAGAVPEHARLRVRNHGRDVSRRPGDRQLARLADGGSHHQPVAGVRPPHRGRRGGVAADGGVDRLVAARWHLHDLELAFAFDDLDEVTRVPIDKIELRYSQF